MVLKALLLFEHFGAIKIWMGHLRRLMVQAALPECGVLPQTIRLDQSICSALSKRVAIWIRRTTQHYSYSSGI